jgi:DNA polymerase III alpha subunit (gram-positive type)
VVPALIDFIGADALSAHNASFDEKFLKAEARCWDWPCRHVGAGVLAEAVAPRVPRHAELQAG